MLETTEFFVQDHAYIYSEIWTDVGWINGLNDCRAFSVFQVYFVAGF